jgi:hypothetical protein
MELWWQRKQTRRASRATAVAVANANLLEMKWRGGFTLPAARGARYGGRGSPACARSLPGHAVTRRSLKSFPRD